MNENLKYIRGRYTFEDKISREGEPYLSGKLEIFDKTTYYVQIFRGSKYTPDDSVYEKAKLLNNKNVVITYKDFSRYTIRDVVDIAETNEICPKVDIEGYKDILRGHIASINNVSYSAFAKAFMKRVDVKTNFFKAPYAETGCFAIEGGLLQYTVDKLEIIDSLKPFILSYIDIDVDFLKLIALIEGAGILNVYEIKDGVAVKTFEGNFVDEKSMTYKMVSECLASADFKLTEEEKYLILHSCVSDDSLHNTTSICKSKESLILTSVKYFTKLINNLLLLKFNNLNNSDFMELFGKSVYVKNL